MRWKEEEIQGAIDSKKLDEKDVDKANRNCPVDVSFYWQFSGEELPRGRTFILEKDDVEEGQEKNLKIKKGPRPPAEKQVS